MAKGTLVSAEASAEMLAIFRQQHYNTMLTHDFPQFYLDCEETGEPELIWVASKSGSMNACRRRHRPHPLRRVCHRPDE